MENFTTDLTDVAHADRKVVCFPANRLTAKQSIISNIRAFPKGFRVSGTSERCWVDCAFEPFNDSRLIISAGLGFSYISGRNRVKFTQTMGLISMCTINSHSNDRVVLHRTNTSLPLVKLHPKSGVLYHVGEKGCVTSSNPDHPTRLSIAHCVSDAEICSLDLSLDGTLMAVVTKRVVCRETGFVLQLMNTKHFNTLFSVDCCCFDGTFRGTRLQSKNISCKLSCDGRLIALGVSTGELIVIESASLKVIFSAFRDLFKVQNIGLCNENSYEFKPGPENKLLTFANKNKLVFFCDPESQTIINKINITAPGSISCIKHARNGGLLAVATSHFIVTILDTDTGLEMLQLEGSTVGPCCYSNRVITGMSFTHFGDVLATACNDGFVYLWNTNPDINLQLICRRLIMQQVCGCDILLLPLPQKIKNFLLR